MSDAKQKISYLWTIFQSGREVSFSLGHGKMHYGPIPTFRHQKRAFKPPCALQQTLLVALFTMITIGSTFRSSSLVYFHASIHPFCFHKRKRGCKTPADNTWGAWLTCCHSHYSLLVCRLKVNSHSGIILILLLFSGGRGNSEVSKEVNQPSQSGNSTESWESCFVFIKDTTWCNSNRKYWEIGKRIMPSAQERLKKMQCCRLRDEGVERPWVDGLSRKVNKHGQPWNGPVGELRQRRLHKVHIQQTLQDMLRTGRCIRIQQGNKGGRK